MLQTQTWTQVKLSHAAFIRHTLGYTASRRYQEEIANRLVNHTAIDEIRQLDNDRFALSLASSDTAGFPYFQINQVLQAIGERPVQVDKIDMEVITQTEAFVDMVQGQYDENGSNSVRFIQPTEARMTIAAINNVPMHIGSAPICIKQIWSDGISFFSTNKLPAKRSLVLAIEALVQGQVVTVFGQIIWTVTHSSHNYEYGMAFLS